MYFESQENRLSESWTHYDITCQTPGTKLYDITCQTPGTNPDERERLKLAIKKAISQADGIYIFDNSPEKIAICQI